ncbi:MAG TPA: hypothetical protein P5065_00670 [Candidatus Ratteibacteria bacterium]|nr:hypothetical protein [bacterium]HON05784.1 hypothetical protein [bacterium]HRS05542.1 hypothetical protein [Candidatus Ratteibacteria bacterium]HRV03621.1 hypothetical protein [Candidatus Ratteibacteria bacterium]
MQIEEKVKEKLPETDVETKNLWKGIYNAFNNGGKEGIRNFVIEQKDKIQNEFATIKEEVEKQVGG